METFRSRKIRLPESTIIHSHEGMDWRDQSPDKRLYFIDYEVETTCGVKPGDRMIKMKELIGLAKGTLKPEEIESFNAIATPEVMESVLSGKLAEKESFQKLPTPVQNLILHKILPFLYEHNFGEALLQTYLEKIPPDNQAFSHIAVCLLSQIVLEKEHELANPATLYFTGLNSKQYYDSFNEEPINCTHSAQLADSNLPIPKIARKSCIYRRITSYSTIPDQNDEL